MMQEPDNNWKTEYTLVIGANIIYLVLFYIITNYFTF